jgi:hypothetical protein
MSAAVSAAVLEPPEGRGFCRYEAALIVDGHLRQLARHEARGRLVLGRLASTFLRRRGQQALGFARLDDYARERLGLSGREVQSLATVADRARALPAVAAAFQHGELSWAKLRLLVRVATLETQEQWLARARGRTVRALEQSIRDAHGPPDTDDAEASVRFSLPCPRRVTRLWQHAVELARRMAGQDLSHGAAAEVVAAEGLSARTPLIDQRLAEPPRPADHADPDETVDAFGTELDWTVLADAEPVDWDALLSEPDAADAFALDAGMRQTVEAMHQLAWQTGRLLRLLFDRRLFLVLGFPSAARYVRERLGISERKVRALVAVERRTWSAPAFGAAYRAGQLSWVRALILVPVIGEDTAGAWVDRARAVSVRRLADEIEWALADRAPGDPVWPPPLGARLGVAERQMCARLESETTDAHVGFRAPVEIVALLRTAILAYSSPAEPLWRGFERLLEHVVAEWAAQPPHRDPIFARDGWRCSVPACSARRNLHDHHVLFRSRGGGNAQSNRITVCAAHHLHGIHAGAIRAWGEAPDGITWELGVRDGRPPLMRFATGEVYESIDVSQ